MYVNDSDVFVTIMLLGDSQVDVDFLAVVEHRLIPPGYGVNGPG